MTEKTVTDDGGVVAVAGADLHRYAGHPIEIDGAAPSQLLWADPEDNGLLLRIRTTHGRQYLVRTGTYLVTATAKPIVADFSTDRWSNEPPAAPQPVAPRPDTESLDIEQLLNTYTDDRDEGVYEDPAGPAYVGANGRRLMLRKAPEGLYVGGALLTSIDDVQLFAAYLTEWAHGANPFASARQTRPVPAYAVVAVGAVVAAAL